VIWTVSVSGALTSACGLGIATLTNGAIPRAAGAIAHSLVGGAVVLLGGFNGFEKVMKVLIATMFFSIVICALLTFHDPLAAAHGLFVPRIPSGGGSSVLSVLGGIGGSIAMMAYNYWLREERMVGPAWAIGPLGFYAFAIGFWSAVFASLLGIWQSIPYLFADFYGLLAHYPRARREALTAVTSAPYRLALLFITVVPIGFAFLDQPLFVIKTFTVVSSLFIPFVAATLLYLNNFRIPLQSGVPKNSALTNAVLVLALVVFALVGASEAGLLGPSR
jgi:hypothetical protein